MHSIAVQPSTKKWVNSTVAVHKTFDMWRDSKSFFHFGRNEKFIVEIELEKSIIVEKWGKFCYCFLPFLLWSPWHKVQQEEEEEEDV